MSLNRCFLNMFTEREVRKWVNMDHNTKKNDSENANHLWSRTSTRGWANDFGWSSMGTKTRLYSELQTIKFFLVLFFKPLQTAWHPPPDPRLPRCVSRGWSSWWSPSGSTSGCATSPRWCRCRSRIRRCPFQCTAHLREEKRHVSGSDVRGHILSGTTFCDRPCQSRKPTLVIFAV